MDMVGEVVRLYAELGNANMPVPRLRRALRHLGIVNAYFAVAAFDSAGGSQAAAALIAPLALLHFAVAMVLLSVWDGTPTRGRRRIARAVARASLVPCAAVLLGAGSNGKTHYRLRSYGYGNGGNVSCLYEYDGSRLVNCCRGCKSVLYGRVA